MVWLAKNETTQAAYTRRSHIQQAHTHDRRDEGRCTTLQERKQSKHQSKQRTQTRKNQGHSNLQGTRIIESLEVVERCCEQWPSAERPPCLRQHSANTSLNPGLWTKLKLKGTTAGAKDETKTNDAADTPWVLRQRDRPHQHESQSVFTAYVPTLLSCLACMPNAVRLNCFRLEDLVTTE